MLYHDDDSYSNYNLNGQPYDTHKRQRDGEKLFECNMKQLGEEEERAASTTHGDGGRIFNC